MASLASSCRATARLAVRQLRTQQRGYQASANLLAAHNFTMPALSPTMTEGNIASWKVKEGDEFAAGDVLLEVETDKAQMDVEAQDDGIMAKIMTEGGAKGVKVGTRIAVIADAGDDISSLDIPPEEKSTPEPASAKEEAKETSSASSKSSSSSSSSTPSQFKSEESSTPTDQPNKSSASKPKGPGQNQKYPLYPSVQVLIHQNQLNVDDIPSSGPNGRLLKGDVLAFMDKVSASYPKELQSRITTLSHLDLSNIKVAPPKEKTAEKKAVEEVKKEAPVNLAVPVSLSAVLQVQQRMSESLGITLPLSTFLARAVALANEDLPASRTAPTADELFDAVLGLDKVHTRRTKNGVFEPQIVALPDPSLSRARPAARKSNKADLFDELVTTPSKKSVAGRQTSAVKNAIGAENIFSLSVDKQEEKRAKVFLERVKTVLEAEPGRLVL